MRLQCWMWKARLLFEAGRRHCLDYPQLADNRPFEAGGARLTRGRAAKRAYWDGVTDQKIRRLIRRPISIVAVARIAAAIPVLAALAPIHSRKYELFDSGIMSVLSGALISSSGTAAES